MVCDENNHCDCIITDISGCDPNPCVYIATCEDVPAPGTGAVCICPSGYEGDGTMGGTGCTGKLNLL